MPNATTPAPTSELEPLRADRDRYANAYRQLIQQLDQKRVESNEHARAIEEKAARGKDGQPIPHECAIAISGLASGYLSAVYIATQLFEDDAAAHAYAQRATDCESVTTAPVKRTSP